MNPSYSYYSFRGFAGFGAVITAGYPEAANCVQNTSTCVSCIACCRTTFKGKNTNKLKGCIGYCKAHWGSDCKDGGITPATTGTPTCGIVCTSGPSSEYGQCHYDCNVPPSSIPNPAPGGGSPITQYQITPQGNYPQYVIDTTTGQAMTDSGSGGGSIGDLISAHPLATLGLLGGAAYYFFFRGRS